MSKTNGNSNASDNRPEFSNDELLAALTPIMGATAAKYAVASRSVATLMTAIQDLRDSIEDDDDAKSSLDELVGQAKDIEHELFCNGVWPNLDW